MSRYFGYPNTIEYIEKSYYSNSEWHEILQGELNAGAPFFYGASGSYGGHVFVCDGYRDDDYYHIVWGWNGSYDGWYKIGSFNPGPYDFNQHHAAIVGIRGPQVPQGVEDVIDNESNQAFVCENPVKDFLHLNDSYKGEIYDMTGRCVTSFDGNTINLTSLSSGPYILRINNNSQIIIKI